MPSMNSSEVATAMAGSYSNAAQAHVDTSFQSLTLHMRAIWVDRADGLWLYVEQSLATTPEKPYRQRVYQVVDGLDATSVECRIFDLPGHPLQFAGAWSEDRPLDSLTPDLLSPREGCTITLRRDALGEWLGTTAQNECATTYHGASYATTTLTLTQRAAKSWDRGYDSSGKQVWGSTTGPYDFVKSSKP